MLLVVEVADETLAQDLGKKAGVYGRAGFAVCWAATREGIVEHTEPTPHGYRTRITYWPGETIPVRYAATELAVDDLLAPSTD